MDKTNLLFSIVIPAYNRAKFLPRAINSVLKQDVSNWELIIVDDGSTDETGKIAKQYNDRRIKYVYQENKGEAGARNTGIKNAKATYICFLDSDDEYLEHHLKILQTYILEYNYPVFYIHTLGYKNKNGQSFKSVLDENKFNNINIGENPEVNCVCIHRKILEKHKFNETFKMHPDAELWARIAKEYPIKTIPEYTAITYIHENNISKGSVSMYYEMLKTYNHMFNDPGSIHYYLPKAKKKDRYEYIYFNLSRMLVKNGQILKALLNISKLITIPPLSLYNKKIISICKMIVRGYIK